jgi:hypothetical protein
MAACGSLSQPWHGPLVGLGAPVICIVLLTLFQVPLYVLDGGMGFPVTALAWRWICNAVTPVEGCDTGTVICLSEGNSEL